MRDVRPSDDATRIASREAKDPRTHGKLLHLVCTTNMRLVWTLLFLVPGEAWQTAMPATRSRLHGSRLRMDASWRPETVDPLGKAFGVPKARERPFELWLDLRTAENTFAQMVVTMLFYAVRRVVDEAGRALPSGAAVQGLLFDEMRYDRADTIGQDLPIFVETSSGLVNATAVTGWESLSTEIRAPTTVEELRVAVAELETVEAPAALALPADPLLWAVSLTGLEPDELQCLQGNEGA